MKRHLTCRERRESKTEEDGRLSKILLWGGVAVAVAVLGLYPNFKTNASQENSRVNKSEYRETVKKAFQGNCKTTILDLDDLGLNHSQYAIAREEFLKLRKENPERFKKVSNDEGTSWILKSYEPNSHQLEIPEYKCK